MRSHSVAFGTASPNAISSAIGYAKFYRRSHDAVIRVYDAAGNVIEAHAQEDFTEWFRFLGEFSPKGTKFMSRIVRFHQTGGPEVLRIDEVEVRAPKAGEVRIAVKALGLN